MWFIFNLHRETPFLSNTHSTYYNNTRGAYYIHEIIYPYLERQSLVHGGEPPILPGPLLEVNCLYAPWPTLTPVPAFPSTGHLFTYKTH
jgi:hypothetical protein